MVERVAEEYRRHAPRLRILLGGEHSVSNGAFLGLAGRPEQTTILQIDAHADLRQDDSDYNDAPHGPYAHCSVMRRAHDLGFHIVQVGIRAYSDEERRLFDDPRITVFEWGPRPASMEEIVAAIPTKTSTSPWTPTVSTGGHARDRTPVPGGLSWYDAIGLLGQAARRTAWSEPIWSRLRLDRATPAPSMPRRSWSTP